MFARKIDVHKIPIIKFNNATKCPSKATCKQHLTELVVVVTHPIVDQATLVKVNYISTHSIEKVLRVRH